MATKKQTTTTEITDPVNQPIPVPAVAKTTKKAGTPKKPAAVSTPEAAPVSDVTAVTPAKKKAAAPKAAPAPKAKAAPASESAALTKVFGQIQTSSGKYFIEKGSVPEGQLQLELPKEGGLTERIPSYKGQFVTILGEFAKQKKTDKSASFVLRNIASHDEIGRRAYELSHENPAAVEDNWFKAENELLQS